MIQSIVQATMWIDKPKSGPVPCLQVCDFCDHLCRYFNVPLDFYC